MLWPCGMNATGPAQTVPGSMAPGQLEQMGALLPAANPLRLNSNGRAEALAP